MGDAVALEIGQHLGVAARAQALQRGQGLVDLAVGGGLLLADLARGAMGR
jgi:hypothetical protein